MATWKSFEDIDAWQMARSFCQDVSRLANKKLDNKDYGLIDQLRNSSGSIMDNIAEGFGRGGTNEFIYFLSVAKGSAAESKSQLYRFLDNNYISKDEFLLLQEKLTQISKKIGGLIAYLSKSNYKGIKYK